MKKYLVTIEFRYSDVSNDGDSTDSKAKTTTIGVFDSLEKANKEGNKALEVFEKHFKLNPHYNRKERFSKNGGCFGGAKNLITDLAYLQTPFSFFAKVTTLNYLNVEETIFEAVQATKRYNMFKIAAKEN